MRKTLTLLALLPFTLTAQATKEYVDLGLSVKWATCNVGADSPEKYGCYFAWGEFNNKDDYDWTTYPHSYGTSSTLTKYCNKPSSGYNGYTDSKTVLDPEDDMAHANWGGDWRTFALDTQVYQCGPSAHRPPVLPSNSTTLVMMSLGRKPTLTTAIR